VGPVARATHAVSIVGLSVNLHILIGVAKGPLRRGARLEAIGPIAESPVLSVRIVHAVGRTQQGISNALPHFYNAIHEAVTLSLAQCTSWYTVY